MSDFGAEAVAAPSHSQRRYRGIAAAGGSALAAKLAALAVNAATVPITVRYLGPESYGIWMTISSTITMFFVLDIGISTTLTNLISAAYARDDRELAREYFATAFWVLTGIAAILGIVFWAVWPYLHWGAILDIGNAALAGETSRAVLAAFLVFLVALPAALITRVLAGYQELHTANGFAAAGSVLSLGAVVAIVWLHGTLAWLVAGFAGATVAANLACMVWVCAVRKPWMKPWPSAIRRAHVHAIFSSGSQFFAIQVAGLVVFSSDNLIIAHYLSPAQVTPYAVTWRLVGYIGAVQALIFPAMWPAYSEAWQRGDLAWIRKAYSRLRTATIAVLAGGCTAMILGGRAAIRIWAGRAAVPPAPLLWLMCVWIAIYAFATNQSCLMGATFRVGKQAVSSVIAAAFNLALSIVWVRSMGPFGVLLATILSYLVFIVAVQTWEVGRILRGAFRPA
jgi:O-antigen/teichoic acid export membrane protein